jgi:hypothetical protein
MLIIYGDNQAVTTGMWNGSRVWIAGKNVSFDVLQTYMDSCIMVVDTIDELWLDMEGIYVINQGGTDVAEEAVLRGAYCLNCSMAEGLWILKDVV